MSFFDLDTSTGLYEGWIKTGQCKVELFTYPGTSTSTVALIVPFVTEDGQQFDKPEMFTIGAPDKWQPVQGKVDAVNTVDPSRNFHAQSGVGRCIQVLSDVPGFVDFAETNYANIGLDVFSNQEFLMKREPVMKDGKQQLDAKGRPKTSVVLANWRPTGQITHVVGAGAASQPAAGASPVQPAPVVTPETTPEVEGLIFSAVMAGKVKADGIVMHAATVAPMQLGAIQKALNDTAWLAAPERLFSYNTATQTFAAK